jgi:two-component system, cell cycle sensor histidine kinase and response regulator CckA
VLEARDGAEALSVAASYPGTIDVMVTDVVMPRLGGVAAAKALQDSRPDIHVIYMSGHVRNLEVLEEIRTTATFMHKPFAPAQLAGKIREVLDRSSRSN